MDQNNPIDVKHVLVEAACDAQKAQGIEPTPKENENIFVKELEKGDRRQESKNKTKPKTKKQGIQKELEKRQEKLGYSAPGKFEITKKAIPKRENKAPLTNAQKRIIVEKWLLKSA